MKNGIHAFGIMVALLSGCATTGDADSGPASVPTSAARSGDAITLNSVRGYHVGGGRVTLSGLPVKEVQAIPGGPKRKSDPNGDYQVGQLYVQHFALAAPTAKYPLLLWHGGGLTGVTWEVTPDGRPGWHEFFMRAGHDTYVSDAVERGRASWARYPELNQGEPEHRTINQAWNMFRFGPEGGYAAEVKQRKAYPGQQFPVEAADQFEKQFVARWTNSDAWAQRAYDELVQQVCPCVILAHSQGSNFALNAAQNAPDKVTAVIVIEPAAAPDPGKRDPVRVKGIPHLVVWGDYFDQIPLWQRYRGNVEKYTSALKAAGGTMDTIDLPTLGIKGNSHMIMMDRNSDQVARLIQDWMIKQGLAKAQ